MLKTKLDKKLIATTVRSREKRIRRREEGETTSSQRKISAQGNQDSSKKNHMKAEDESPTQRRNCKNDNDDEAEKIEDTGSKGGGRLKHCIIDGDDVPLCLRRKLSDSNESSSSVRKRYEEKESRSSTQSNMNHCVMNNTASGSEGTCPRSTEEKHKHSKHKEVTFVILQKT